MTKKNEPKFKIGDIVCYKIGTTPYIILNIFKSIDGDNYLYQIESEDRKGYIGELCLKKYIKSTHQKDTFLPNWKNLYNYFQRLK